MANGSLLLTDGTVYPLDDACSNHAAIRFEDGVVTAVGDDLEPRTDESVIDLEGATVLPGFNDAHAHVLSVGTRLHETDLSDVDDRSTALERLESNADRTEKGAWVLGFGYDESTWPADEQTPLRRSELDRVTTDHPVAVQRVDGHAVSLNSEGLARVDFEGVEHDVRLTGEDPNGVVVEDAAIRVREATYPSPAKARTVLQLGVERATALGITSLQDMAGMATPAGEGDPAHAAFFAAWREDELPVRLGYYVHANRANELSTLELASGFGDEQLRLLGLKVFADGSIGSQTAKLEGDFADDPGNDGQFVIDPDTLREKFELAARANQQIATHAIGTEAIDVVLDAYEHVLDRYDVPDPRLRIEHAEIATDDQIERMRDLGVIASMQPNFLQWSGEDGLYERRLGREWRRANNRFPAYLEAGVGLAFGSDTMPIGPLHGIHQAVNAPHECQRLSVEAALRAYTHGSAYAEGEEERKGTLEPGMLADAVILDRDPFDNPEEIDSFEVLGTIVGGRVVYRTGEGTQLDPTSAR